MLISEENQQQPMSPVPQLYDSSSDTPSTEGSPSFDQFASSLFDLGPDTIFASGYTAGSDTETLFSNDISLNVSPKMKTEDETELVSGDMCAFDDIITETKNNMPAGRGTNDIDTVSTMSAQDVQSLAASKVAKKKRAPRKRLTPHQKEAHNKIERKYRININTKIARLQQIIPWVASEETAFDVDDSLRSKNTMLSSEAEAATLKLNKSMILEKAVDYILFLQNNERLYELEVQRLKRELGNLRAQKETEMGNYNVTIVNEKR